MNCSSEWPRVIKVDEKSNTNRTGAEKKLSGRNVSEPVGGKDSDHSGASPRLSGEISKRQVLWTLYWKGWGPRDPTPRTRQWAGGTRPVGTNYWEGGEAGERGQLYIPEPGATPNRDVAPTTPLPCYHGDGSPDRVSCACAGGRRGRCHDAPRGRASRAPRFPPFRFRKSVSVTGGGGSQRVPAA